jgi:hypothetical protein
VVPGADRGGGGWAQLELDDPESEEELELEPIPGQCPPFMGAPLAALGGGVPEAGGVVLPDEGSI